jgi:hypothetical protein
MDSGNPDAVKGIDTQRTPLHLLTGEYDYSATPAESAQVHRLVVTIMKGLGHFPMAENYPRFRTYLFPLLDQLTHTAAQGATL